MSIQSIIEKLNQKRAAAGLFVILQDEVMTREASTYLGSLCRHFPEIAAAALGSSQIIDDLNAIILQQDESIQVRGARVQELEAEVRRLNSEIADCLAVLKKRVHHETANLLPATMHIVSEWSYWVDRCHAAEARVEDLGGSFGVGDLVTVFDRYRFAIPLKARVVDLSMLIENGGVAVSLLESNNPTFPVGAPAWVHVAQLRKAPEVPNGRR
jgi:hypothetical protein